MALARADDGGAMREPRAHATTSRAPRWRLPLAAALAGAVSVGWLDPHATVREANRLYAAGKYEEAASTYNQALVDDPDSARIHFALGDTAYKQGKYAEAVEAFQKVPIGDDDPARAARVAYNVGNARYRLGEAAEASDPKAALGLYAEALVAYRRTLAAMPEDEDAKFNHELAEKKLNDLKKKLEEQQRQQEQQDKQQQEGQQQEQQNEEQAGNEGEEREQEEEQQAGGQQDEHAERKPEDERGEAQQAEPPEEQQAEGQDGEQQQGQQHAESPQAREPRSEPPAERQAAAGSAGEGERTDEMSRREASALLDSQRDQELRPDEIIKRKQGVVAEPAQDW